MKNQRILALVCEPWQTKSMAKLLCSLEGEHGFETFSLGVMDYYQMVHQLKTFEDLKLPQHTEIKNQNQMYIEWQALEEDPNLISQEFLDNWEKSNCKSRSLADIAAGNQLVRQWERTQYTLPITPYWESRVLHDTIKWCEDYYREFRPTVVISIERFELANSIFFEICRREGIPMLTFIGSRIDSRWILRTDFGYGMSGKTLEEVEAATNNLSALKEAKRIVERMSLENSGTYESDSRVLVKRMQKNNREKIEQIIIETRKLAGNIYARHFIEPKNYAIRVRRFEEDHFKLTKYLVRRHLIRSVRLFGLLRVGSMQAPRKPYLLWALHYRPETSGLVLGDGRDEIQELFKVANNLPSGWILAVKENSLMVGERFPGFYRKLRRVKNIELIDANADTNELVKKSNGVVGISGTVLLEAAALGIPSCALGSPEFNEMLTHTGWDSLDGFLKDILSGNSFVSRDQSRVLRYIAYVVSKSSEKDVKYLSDENSPNLEIMMRRFAQEVCDALQHQDQE